MYEGTDFLTSCCHCCYYYFEKTYIQPHIHIHIHTLVCIGNEGNSFIPLSGFILIPSVERFNGFILMCYEYVYCEIYFIFLWILSACVCRWNCVDVNEWICCMRIYILGRVNNSFNAILWIYVFYSLVVQIFWVAWFELKLDLDVGWVIFGN